MLGICLGAQLIAMAMGANVHAGNGAEIGWAPLRLSQAGQEGPLRHLEDVAVLHWHGDTFDIPEGCTLLASTDAYPHQAFAHDRHLLALQCHVEVAAISFERWLIGHAGELGKEGLDPRMLRADALRFAEMLEARAALVIGEWLAGLATVG